MGDTVDPLSERGVYGYIVLVIVIVTPFGGACLCVCFVGVH